jgi:TatD DNase family protein
MRASGSAAELRAYLDRGFFIGLTGFICRPNRAGDTLRALSELRPPLERLMVETDAPFMMPNVPKAAAQALGVRQGQNEPCLLPWVVETLAAALQRPVEEVAQGTMATTRKFFALP